MAQALNYQSFVAAEFIKYLHKADVPTSIIPGLVLAKIQVQRVLQPGNKDAWVSLYNLFKGPSPDFLALLYDILCSDSATSALPLALHGTRLNDFEALVSAQAAASAVPEDAAAAGSGSAPSGSPTVPAADKPKTAAATAVSENRSAGKRQRPKSEASASKPSRKKGKIVVRRSAHDSEREEEEEDDEEGEDDEDEEEEDEGEEEPGYMNDITAHGMDAILKRLPCLLFDDTAGKPSRGGRRVAATERRTSTGAGAAGAGMLPLANLVVQQCAFETVEVVDTRAAEAEATGGLEERGMHPVQYASSAALASANSAPPPWTKSARWAVLPMDLAHARWKGKGEAAGAGRRTPWAHAKKGDYRTAACIVYTWQLWYHVNHRRALSSDLEREQMLRMHLLNGQEPPPALAAYTPKVHEPHNSSAPFLVHQRSSGSSGSVSLLSDFQSQPEVARVPFDGTASSLLHRALAMVAVQARMHPNPHMRKSLSAQLSPSSISGDEAWAENALRWLFRTTCAVLDPGMRAEAAVREHIYRATKPKLPPLKPFGHGIQLDSDFCYTREDVAQAHSGYTHWLGSWRRSKAGESGGSDEEEEEQEEEETAVQATAATTAAGLGSGSAAMPAAAPSASSAATAAAGRAERAAVDSVANDSAAFLTLLYCTWNAGKTEAQHTAHGPVLRYANTGCYCSKGKKGAVAPGGEPGRPVGHLLNSSLACPGAHVWWARGAGTGGGGDSLCGKAVFHPGIVIPSAVYGSAGSSSAAGSSSSSRGKAKSSSSRRDFAARATKAAQSGSVSSAAHTCDLPLLSIYESIGNAADAIEEKEKARRAAGQAQAGGGGGGGVAKSLAATCGQEEVERLDAYWEAISAHVLDKAAGWHPADYAPRLQEHRAGKERREAAQAQMLARARAKRAARAQRKQEQAEAGEEEEDTESPLPIGGDGEGQAVSNGQGSAHVQSAAGAGAGEVLDLVDSDTSNAQAGGAIHAEEDEDTATL